MTTPIVTIENNSVFVEEGDPIIVEVRPVGQAGEAGEGVPPGGDTGQILAKASDDDYDTVWIDNDALGVQSVTGDGVGGTASNVVMTFPTVNDIGAYSNTNPSGFVNSAGAANAAPVQSVNGDTGNVTVYNGGNTSDILVKLSGTDYDTAWTGDITVDSVTYDITAGIEPDAQGETAWNAEARTLAINKGNGVVQNVTQDLNYAPARNTEATALVRGELVMVDPTQPAQGQTLRLKRYVSDGTLPVDLFVGMVAEAIAPNETGFVEWFGQLRGLSLSALEPVGETWAEGDILWPNPAIAGGMTKVEPTAPAHKVTVAAILRITGNLLNVLVRPNLRSRIVDLHDVQVTNASNAQVLTYQNGVWVNATNPADGVLSVTGDGVGGTATNVVMTFPTVNQIGAYSNTNPSAFINVAGAPVQSVNGDTGIVVITANSIGAYLNTNPNSFVNVAQASASAPVQSVTGTLVTGTSADPVVNIPTLDQVGAYSNTNPSAFINVAQAPVQSVNGDTGIVVLNADDVGAYSNTNPNSFINIAQVPIKTVTGDGVDNSNVGNVVISYPTINDIGAYSNTNPDGFVNSAGAALASPVQSVNGQTNVVVLGANDVGAYSNTNPSAFINIAQASSAAPIQTVTGDGVDNSNVGNVVISFPTLDDIGAYSNTNPANYINVAQASAAAPVQSVNGQTNVVVLDADDVGAYSNTNPSAFINVAGAPVQSVNGDTGIVVITANSIGAYLNTNPNNFINSAQAPVQSVNGDTGIVVLALGDINDVNISGVTNGQSLVYNATATEWRAVTISGGGGAVDSVNGQTGVVVLDADDVGAYSNTNPSSFINVAQAPVQSVNGSTGIVVITANSIGAYLNTNPNAFVNTAQATAAAPIKTVTGQGVNNSNVGNVVISFPTINDIGAYSNTNPSNFINSAGAPVQSVNGQTGTVSLLLTNLSDVNTAGVTNGQVIVYNSTSLAWQAGTVSGGDGAVDSVNGQTGVVVLDASDVGAIPTSEKAAANGVATLGATSILVQNTNYAFRYTPEGFYCRDASGTSNDRQFGTSTSYVLLNPVMIWSDIAVDRLAMNVVTNGGALSTYRICFYKVNEGSDVMDIVAGSEVLFDTTTNGVKIATVDIVLTKGLYMIGCLNQTGATDVIYTAANGKASFAYRHADRIFSLATNDAIRLGGTFTGSFPSTLTLAVNNNLYQRPALIFFRIKP